MATNELTNYEKWQKLENEAEKMRFFFKNSMAYKNFNIRYSTKQNGFYITDSIGRKIFCRVFKSIK